MAKDGQNRFPISIAEAEARASAHFKNADKDKDGLLSKDEFAQLRPEQSVSYTHLTLPTNREV